MTIHLSHKFQNIEILFEKYDQIKSTNGEI